MLDVLRGNPGERPQIRPELQRELHLFMARELEHVEHKMVISKRQLGLIHKCEGLYMAPSDFQWNPRNARGTIAHKAIELSSGGHNRVTPMALVEAAMERLCESRESVGDYIRGTGEAERAELRASTVDLVSSFIELFPPIPDHWKPVAEATTAASITDEVTLRGRIDLKLGSARGKEPGSLIIDFKTGVPSFGDLDDLRFYGLVECLRTGVPPFRWASVYLEPGRAEQETASEGALWAAAKRCVDAIIKIDALEQLGKEPELTPGPGCRFCPVRDDCPVSAADNPQDTLDY
jgi:RecB family exonuclease